MMGKGKEKMQGHWLCCNDVYNIGDMAEIMGRRMLSCLMTTDNTLPHQLRQSASKDIVK
jgi:hypothetical protein